MTDLIKRVTRESRQHMPIVVGFFTVFIIIAIIVGFIMFFAKRKSSEK